MSRREQIKMSEAEVAAFLAEERTVTCATIGPRGWPHLMPLWYVLRERPAGEPGPRMWAWTYAASQKVRNLERDPRATLQVEAGEALRGAARRDARVRGGRSTASSRSSARSARDLRCATPSPRGRAAAAELPARCATMVDAQAAKRVALEFVERRRASWDHRKLGGVY